MSWEIRVLDPREVSVTEAGIDSVNLRIRSEVYERVVPKRPFPLSHPEVVAFYTEEGVELGVLEDYRELDDESRKKLENVLRTIYYVPKVKAVRSIERGEGKYTWKVLVEGMGELEIETWSDCVKVMPDGRIFLFDVDGGVYEVERLSSLDARSKALLMAVL